MCRAFSKASKHLYQTSETTRTDEAETGPSFVASRRGSTHPAQRVELQLCDQRMCQCPAVAGSPTGVWRLGSLITKVCADCRELRHDSAVDRVLRFCGL